jgi:hypothetical protein
MFLTCHNYWIVCRLVKDARHPYLAYSQLISIENSSEPFRAFIGAILSVIKGIPVEPSEYSPDMELDIILEEHDDGPLSENDLDDGSGEYQGDPDVSVSTSRPFTRSRAQNENVDVESKLIVRPFLIIHALLLGLLIFLQATASSPNSPEYFQIWVHLYGLSNNTRLNQRFARDGMERLWLTRFIASGSTGNVWECRLDSGDKLFAVKVVEMLRPSDADSRLRLRKEFNVYLTLDQAYQSGQLPKCIAPRCYGAFTSKRMDFLILDLCDSILNDWGELSAAER